jgi:hypothetical protein
MSVLDGCPHGWHFLRSAHLSGVILKVDEEHDDRPKEEILQLFDEEVEKFSSYMASLTGVGGGPLGRGEKVLIKSYLVAKFSGKV